MQVDRNQLKDVLRQVLLPAVIGGAGGGALSAYTASKANPEGENPQQRRRRIIRNALTGAALGGGAGAAIPTGWKMLTDPYFGDPAATNVGQQAANHVARNAGTYLSSGLAVGGLKTLANRDRGAAFKHILDNVSKTKVPGVGNESQLRDYLGASQGNRNTLIDRLVAPQGMAPIDAHKGRMRWNQIFSQAGYEGMPLSDMAGGGSGGPMTTHSWEANPRGENVLDALRQTLLESSSLPESARGFGPAGLMSKLVGKGELGTDIARRYVEDFSRPATKMLNNRWGTIPRLGVAAGGALLGKSIWDSMRGN